MQATHLMVTINYQKGVIMDGGIQSIRKNPWPLNFLPIPFGKEIRLRKVI